jgi:AmmeMemoRadiSam system protein A
MAFEDELRLGAREGEALLSLAREAVSAQVREGRATAVPGEVLARFPRLGARRGAFVTLSEHGRLRGCIGSLEATEPLAADVIHNAASAAVRDSRFAPVAPDELGAIDLSISVLDTPRPLPGVQGDALVKKLAATHPGVVLHFQGRRSTFLPEVWSQLPDASDFLDHLCQKQGESADCWRSAEARFEVYGAQHLGK